MTPYVIDTSALVKLVIPEDHSDTVADIAELYRASRIQLVAPDFILLECANVLWKYARRDNAPISDMISAIETLIRIDLRLVPQAELIEDALRFALDVGITVYDAVFCVTARRNQSELITAALRLVNSLAGSDIRTITLHAWNSRT